MLDFVLVALVFVRVLAGPVFVNIADLFEKKTNNTKNTHANAVKQEHNDTVTEMLAGR